MSTHSFSPHSPVKHERHEPLTPKRVAILGQTADDITREEDGRRLSRRMRRLNTGFWSALLRLPYSLPFRLLLLMWWLAPSSLFRDLRRPQRPWRQAGAFFALLIFYVGPVAVLLTWFIFAVSHGHHTVPARLPLSPRGALIGRR